MLTFDFITIFPDIIKPYFEESLFKRAQEIKLLAVNVHNLRDFTGDKHNTVDDSPYGGGFGMVFKIEPIFKAVLKIAKLKLIKNKLKPGKNTIIILPTPRGKIFNQKMAAKFAKAKQVVFICGRYEGVDERAAKNLGAIEVSIGDYDLMGGELAAMTIAETVSRLIPGVIGKEGFLKERSGKEGFFESAQYTRPEIFTPKKGINWRVPKELLCGDPKVISDWRQKHGKII